MVGQAVVDGESGIDNSMGATLLPTTGSALPCLEDNLALTQGRGVGTILLWVQGWNGLSDDASVTAMLTTAVDGTNEDPSLVGFRDNDAVNLVYLSGSRRRGPRPRMGQSRTRGSSTRSTSRRTNPASLAWTCRRLSSSTRT